MSSTGDRPAQRRRVANRYGHPWPWQSKTLVEEYAIDQNIDLQSLADRWACTPWKLRRWVRRHGFHIEDGQAKR